MKKPLTSIAVLALAGSAVSHLSISGVLTVNAADVFVKPEALIINQASDAIVQGLQLPKPLGKGATKEMAADALRQFVDQYQTTRVSHIYWNVCYQRAAYRSEAWASYWDVPNPEKDVISWPRRYYELHKLGIDDVFALLIPRSRERGISPWVSLRMNDMHYHEDPNRMNPFWNENPEFWTHEKPGFHNGFNFTHTEVRAHYMKLVCEVLTRWDIDGVSLDWMRFPHHCKPGELDDCRAALTEFTRDVRRQADAAAKRLGHPVGVAVRVPATPEFSFGLGMDALTWAKEGLIDVLIPCSLWRPSFPDIPVETWREQIGGESECAIVPGSDLWIGGTRGGAVAGTGMAPIRGFTASMLDRGADGIYLFNHFDPVKTPVDRYTFESGVDAGQTLGDLLAMAGDVAKATNGPRRHILTFHDPVPRNSSYKRPLPARLAPGEPAQFRLHIGPDAGHKAALVRIGLADADGMDAASIRISVNGTPCRQIDDFPPKVTEKTLHGHVRHLGQLAPRLLQFTIDSAALKRGYNEIEVEQTSPKPQTLIWLELRLSPSSPPP
jgi:hypothetical protein